VGSRAGGNSSPKIRNASRLGHVAAPRVISRMPGWTSRLGLPAPMAAFAIGISVAAGAVLALAPTKVDAALVLVCAGSLLLIVPRSWLASVSLLLFLLVPVAYLNVPTISRYLSPLVVVLGVWAGRTFLAGREEHPSVGSEWTWVSVALIAWLILRTATSIQPHRSAFWVIAFVISVPMVGSAARRTGAATRDALMTTWAWAGVVWGAIGCVEGVSHWNPLAVHYTVSGTPLRQIWSVYRIETTMGHPLLNALFFSTTAALMGVLAVTRPTLLRFSAATLSAVALAFTASRAGVLGLALGAAAAIVALLFSSSLSVGRKLAILSILAIAVIGIAEAPILKQRERSQEGLASAAYRQETVSDARAAMRRYAYLGSGPGTSQVLFSREGLNPRLESSALQILVSDGVPGMIGLALLVIYAGLASIRRRRWETLAALIAYLTCAAGFNAWDSNPETLGLLGLLLILALTPLIDSGFHEALVHVNRTTGEKTSTVGNE
jgi:polysaccharide biosynthesis protein PslJ